ncbi:phosphomevalonate kinase [Lentzea sp. NPDC006480]|uniref:phosphomevalonate kinase n=1 Tax=Lentzea sp. NPDC006480 TaxID=3157176 RepID=UPI0033A70C69
MNRTSVRYAPGKLFVLGEYAVLEPGVPALLATVNRGVTVSVTAADEDLVIHSDLTDRPARLSRRASGLPANAGPVVAAVQVVTELLAEWDLPAPRVELCIQSGLHDYGVKYGLGSSGAVMVATIDALLAHCGVSLCIEERFRLAMLASARLDVRSSGGDLAASTYGGWIVYQAPDRTAVVEFARAKGVREALQAPWPGFDVYRVPSPRDLVIVIGWTGTPSSTSDHVSAGVAHDWHGSADHCEFVSQSTDCVTTAAAALGDGEDSALLGEIRRARRLLANADSQGGLGLFTGGLTAMCDAAESVGGAAKPSGAGGGDCGIAFLEPHQGALSHMRDRWLEAGIVPLPFRTYQSERTCARDR